MSKQMDMFTDKQLRIPGTHVLYINDEHDNEVQTIVCNEGALEARRLGESLIKGKKGWSIHVGFTVFNSKYGVHSPKNKRKLK